MKNIILFSAIFLFTASSFAADCSDFAYNKVLPTTREKVTVLCKNGFVIGYDANMKTLRWVAERIEPNTPHILKQRPPFHKDTAVSHDQQSSNSDFIGTGYDKGHMVPFEDMSYSAQSAYDSMSLTNIVPQNFANNRGGWKSLEEYARKAAKNGPIYVVSGPIFEGKIDYIGNHIPIPTKLFKVIINPDAKVAKTFILPNIPISSYETKQYEFTRAEVVAGGIDPTPGAQLTDVK